MWSERFITFPCEASAPANANATKQNGRQDAWEERRPKLKWTSPHGNSQLSAIMKDEEASLNLQWDQRAQSFQLPTKIEFFTQCTARCNETLNIKKTFSHLAAPLAGHDLVRQHDENIIKGIPLNIDCWIDLNSRY